MIVLPAIDLREGACVQLEGGSYDRERIRIPEPLNVAKDWFEQGFDRLHIVDLDAATERGGNAAIVEDLLMQYPDRLQVGGGVRDREKVGSLIESGSRSVVVGTKAVADRNWLVEIATEFPGKVIVALDVMGREIVVRGWQERSGHEVVATVAELDELDLAGILCTAVHVEGARQGPDVGLIADVAKASRNPVLASGGVATIDDLRQLRDAGAAATVVGMALYSGDLDPQEILEEFS